MHFGTTMATKNTSPLQQKPKGRRHTRQRLAEVVLLARLGHHEINSKQCRKGRFTSSFELALGSHIHHRLIFLPPGENGQKLPFLGEGEGDCSRKNGIGQWQTVGRLRIYLPVQILIGLVLSMWSSAASCSGCDSRSQVRPPAISGFSCDDLLRNAMQCGSLHEA